MTNKMTRKKFLTYSYKSYRIYSVNRSEDGSSFG